MTDFADYKELYKESQARLCELMRIAKSEWSSAERIVAIALKISTWERTDFENLGQWAVIGDGGAEAVASMAHLSKSTANNVINKLTTVGLVDRHIEKTPVDRFGQEIKRKPQKEQGDHWQNTSTIAILAHLPEVLPKLNDTSYTTKQRAKSSEVTRLARLAKELQSMPCPHCGVIGELHIGCSACGATLTAGELDNLSTQLQPDEPSFEVQTSTNVRNSNVISSDVQNLHTSGNTERGADTCPSPALSVSSVDVQDSYAEALTGADSIDWLAKRKAKFSFAYRPRLKDTPQNIPEWIIKDKGKEGWGGDYLDKPHDGIEAKAWLEKGGNIGFLSEHSKQPWLGTLIILDIDSELQAFLTRFPALAKAVRIVRRNAPERAKLLIWLTNCPNGLEYIKREYRGRKLEVFGNRHHAIVAGQHQTGAVIELLPGNIPLLSRGELMEIVNTWTPCPKAESKVFSQIREQSTDSNDLIRLAIHWWNEQPANIAEVDRLLGQRKRQGSYFAVRPNDNTPSTRAISGDAWRDYGTDETALDRYEIWLRLTNTKKYMHKWQVAHDYLIAHGRTQAAKRIAAKIGL